LWRQWLAKNGMVCPSCGHIFTTHMGTRLNPPQPELCTVCAVSGPCRRTSVTGKCDQCGTQVFEP
jgi:predicted RNA-binding Zn-ribbon protein involved in translation (DUF1610 family)